MCRFLGDRFPEELTPFGLAERTLWPFSAARLDLSRFEALWNDIEFRIVFGSHFDRTWSEVGNIRATPAQLGKACWSRPSAEEPLETTPKQLSCLCRFGVYVE